MRWSGFPWAVLVAAGALFACGDRPVVDDATPPAPDGSSPSAVETPPSDIFHGIPVLRGSRLIGGSLNAAQVQVEVPMAADSVARVYRRNLVAGSWDIRGDVTAPDGSVTIHARSAEDRPVWIMIRPTGAGTSEVSLVATAVDSAADPR